MRPYRSPCGNSVAAFRFDLSQCFEIAFESPDVKRAKLSLEGRVIGLLRKASHEIKECFRLASEDIHIHKTLQSDRGSVFGGCL